MVKEVSSLHNHTDFSNALLGFPDSVNKLEEFIYEAYKLGLKGVAITEHEGIMSHVKAIKYFKELKQDELEEGNEFNFKLMLGNEIYLMSEDEDFRNRNNEEDRVPYYHFVLNALDEQGHKQIRELSDRAWKRAYTYRGLMRRPTYYTDIEEVIGSNQGHIVASTACLGGYLPKHILKWKQNNDINSKIKVGEFMQWGLKTFGKDNFYLEIQPCKSDNEEQIIVNQTLDYISKRTGIKLIVTTDSHYLSKDKAFVHKTLLNSKDGDREVDSFYATAYLMGADELRDYLRLTFDDDRIDELFQNTNEIIDRGVWYDFEHTPQIPKLPDGEIPPFKITHRYKEYYEKYQEFNYYAYVDNLDDQYFFYRIEQALYTLIEQKGKNIDEYISRLNDEFRELRLISEAFNSSMASYYVTMSKIIEMIWETDSLSMVARGSGAGFLVCYLLEITQIDPVPLGDYFPFWRHLSAERGVEIAD